MYGAWEGEFSRETQRRKEQPQRRPKTTKISVATVFVGPGLPRRHVSGARRDPSFWSKVRICSSATRKRHGEPSSSAAMRPASSAVLYRDRTFAARAAAGGQGAGEPLPSLARGGGVNPQTDRGAHAAGEKVSTSLDLPLSHECKRVLAFGAEEAQRLNHKHIGTEHLLLGILREEKCLAAQLLGEQGLTLRSVREQVQRPETPASSGRICLLRPPRPVACRA